MRQTHFLVRFYFIQHLVHFLDCVISVNDPFKQVQPLFTNRKFVNEILPNTDDGRVILRPGTKIGVCCPGSCDLVTCVSNKEFESDDGTTIDIINDPICPRSDKFEPKVKRTGKSCGGGVGEWLQSGLEFGSTSSKKFIELYNVCFNMENSSPVLVAHELTFGHTKQQPNVDCPSTWFHRGFFGDVGNPNAKYTKRNALSALASQLGSQTKAEQLVDANSATKFLARGHMLPKGDMVFAPAKLATCSLVSNILIQCIFDPLFIMINLD